MKKEEFIENIKNSKIYVNGKSKEILEKLYQVGVTWTGTGRRVSPEKMMDPFLFINDELKLTRSYDMRVFINQEGREISAEFILETVIEDIHKLKKYSVVLVKNRKSKDWKLDIFLEKKLLNSIISYECYHRNWDICVPFKGNEDLIQSTVKIED